jgi:hypothetical protein
MPIAKIQNDVPETPPNLPGAGLTERGFVTYASFLTEEGTDVTIRQSSLATADYVWLFTQETERSASAHLSVEQATIVRDALNAFLAVHGGD